MSIAWLKLAVQLLVTFGPQAWAIIEQIIEALKNQPKVFKASNASCPCDPADAEAFRAACKDAGVDSAECEAAISDLGG